MESEQHKQIVVALIKYFEKKRYRVICADSDGYNSCPEQTSHIPDVIAEDSTQLYHIAEAEICNSLESEQTIEQFKEFSNRVMKKDGRHIHFYVAIPSNCETKLNNLLKKENLKSSFVHVLLYD